ncbi:hypothetical protein JRQ81_016548 [Phrynocephalus forsythii]|uniref:Uncharacterized protein n=1 Tax=Phrynocephalus forsythii TaxID=171643 RepID=A0A9Q0XT22_9SAUR|nr:hypothetical protein JRQ81_016548 [Phrynocephalus forsythii]
MIKEQINKARCIPRDKLLQDRSKEANNRTPLVVTYNPQVRPLTQTLNDLQTILDKSMSLSKALCWRTIFDYRQPPNLKHIPTHTRLQNSKTANGINLECLDPETQFSQLTMTPSCK